MKKIISVFFIFVVLLCLSSCGHQHNWIDATCTSPKTCSECGKTEGEALGHNWIDATYDAPKTCSRCGKTEGSALKSSWEKEYYVDEFGNKDNSSYIRGIFEGTYGNSNISGRDLMVVIAIDGKQIRIRLLENNNYKVTVSSNETVTIKTQDDNGKVWSGELYHSQYLANGDLFTSDDELYTAIVKNESLSCIIKIESRYSSSEYKFKVDNKGLENLLSK